MQILAPKNCPSCQSPLERVNDQLFCRNKDNCPAQSSKRLQAFCKKLKFKGFGEKTLEQLKLEDFNSFLSLTKDGLEDLGMSPNMATKLVGVVSDRLSKGIAPSDFLSAVSIPRVGGGSLRKLSIARIDDITYNQCIDSGLGDLAAKSLVDWISNEWPKYKANWQPHFIKTIRSQKPKVIVCITGKLNEYKNREAATEFLISKGFEVRPSVTKSVTYLICEDNSTSSSLKRAISYGIPITTINKLLEEINE